MGTYLSDSFTGHTCHLTGDLIILIVDTLDTWLIIVIVDQVDTDT